MKWSRSFGQLRHHGVPDAGDLRIDEPIHLGIDRSRIAVERFRPFALEPRGDAVVVHGGKFIHSDSRRGCRTECAVRTGASTRRQPPYSSSYSGVR